MGPKRRDADAPADLPDDVPGSDADAEARDAVRAHRPDVVRRLLERGLSREAIERLLPGWSDLLDE